MNHSLTSHPCLLKQVERHPYPLLFATISGAHLYGFPSPDSDFDLRGVHIQSSPEHEELKSLATGCITRHHAFHYLGFADTQWRLFQKEDPPRVKPLLYVYRVLLTGIHLMKTGKIEANLSALNEEYRLPYIPDLIARKTTGKEKEVLDHADMEFHSKEFARLVSVLEQSHADCQLPEQPSCTQELNDLLVRIRLAAVDSVRGDS